MILLKWRWEGRECKKIEDQTVDVIMEDYLEICFADVEIAKYYSLLSYSYCYLQASEIQDVAKFSKYLAKKIPI